MNRKKLRMACGRLQAENEDLKRKIADLENANESLWNTMNPEEWPVPSPEDIEKMNAQKDVDILKQTLAQVSEEACEYMHLNQEYRRLNECLCLELDQTRDENTRLKNLINATPELKETIRLVRALLRDDDGMEEDRHDDAKTGEDREA